MWPAVARHRDGQAYWHVGTRQSREPARASRLPAAPVAACPLRRCALPSHRAGRACWDNAGRVRRAAHPTSPPVGARSADQAPPRPAERAPPAIRRLAATAFAPPILGGLTAPRPLIIV